VTADSHFADDPLPRDVQRRDVVEAVFGVVALTVSSGCTAFESSGTTTDHDTRQTPTEREPPTESSTPPDSHSPIPTPADTPVPVPETCDPLPALDGVPAPPPELTRDTAESFAVEFERAYAVRTEDEYGGVESIRVRSVETVGERYVVALSVDAAPVSATPDADGTTPTSLPIDAYTHRAVYRLTDGRMLRELRSHIDGSLRSWTCFTL
jgi:hypothetical protein